MSETHNPQAMTMKRCLVTYFTGAALTGLVGFTELIPLGKEPAQLMFFLLLTLGVVSLFLEYGPRDHETL